MCPIFPEVEHYPNTRRNDIMGYFTILAAIPGFFVSSLITMLLWGVIAQASG